MAGRRVLATVIVHLASSAAAYFATGVIHVLSGRGIWALFPSAYHVRQLSIYAMDAMPFLVAALLVLSFVHTRIAGRTPARFGVFMLIGLAAAGAALWAHQPFFPTGARAALYLAVMAALYICAYPVIDKILFGWLGPRRRPRPFPDTPSAGAGLITGIAICVIYIGFFRIGGLVAGLSETALYEAALEPTQSAHQAAADEATARLFKMEALDIPKGAMRFVDLDRDGHTDAVIRTRRESLEFWRNENGALKRQKGYFHWLNTLAIHDFYFADYDNDGRLDMLVSIFDLPRQSTRITTFWKKSFWYPAEDSVSHGRLYRQHAPGQWRDVTDKAFPGGALRAFRKVEPILWFDANQDGLLDFVWSQYPHPRRSLNRLYVQNRDGSFTDRMAELIRTNADRVYAEGSDVADFDGDGDIDLFAYGHLFRREGKMLVQVCGTEVAGIHCDGSGRNEEGALFEDINGDGNMDLVLSHHGPGGVIPKYYLQLFLGDGNSLKRARAFERQFYGFHTYLRAKDFDFNGRPDILTQTAGRLLRFDHGRWVDLLPAISAAPSGAFEPMGWLDIDEDGDWDFIAERKSDGAIVLFRNQHNPKRFMKISAVGPGGADNQYGATMRIKMLGGKIALRAYRPMAGYAGVTDPRIVVALGGGHAYEIKACFPSLKNPPVTPGPTPGVLLIVTGVAGNCVEYRLEISPSTDRLDIKLVAGRDAAIIQAR